MNLELINNKDAEELNVFYLSDLVFQDCLANFIYKTIQNIVIFGKQELCI